MPDTDLAAVQAGAVAFDMDSVKGFCKLGAITLLDTRRHIPAKDHDRWQRRAIEAAVEVLYREPMPEPAGMRAASTLYSGGGGGRTAARWRKEQRAVNTAAILGGSDDAEVQKNIEQLGLQQMSGNDAFVFLFLVDRARRYPARRDADGTPVIHTTLAELALLVYGRDETKTRRQIGGILGRLQNMDAVIKREDGAVGAGKVVGWVYVKEDGGRRVGLEITIHRRLLARMQAHHYGISLLYMYLMNGADLVAYDDDGGIAKRWGVYDTLTPTARDFARKLYITSKIIGWGKITDTLPGVMAGWLECTAGITRAAQSSALSAMQWLAARGSVDVSDVVARRGMPRQYTITRGARLARLEAGADTRDYVRAMRQDIDTRGIQVVDTITDAITGGRGAVVVRRTARSVSGQPDLLGAIRP